jgi:hypothetical protein
VTGPHTIKLPRKYAATLVEGSLHAALPNEVERVEVRGHRIEVL